jgi:hypothetical protein
MLQPFKFPELLSFEACLSKAAVLTSVLNQWELGVLTLFNVTAVAQLVGDTYLEAFFAVFLTGTLELPCLTFSLEYLPLVADSQVDTVAGTPRTLWAVIFQVP